MTALEPVDAYRMATNHTPLAKRRARPCPKKPVRLVIVAERGGSIAELSAFLSDLENAYMALYTFDRLWFRSPMGHRFPLEMLLELGYPFSAFGQVGRVPLRVDALPPSARLTLERVRIESPGFWEFVASLNPLQQIREYLNDRHRRRQDIEFREAPEKKRLELDNELIQRQIEENDNTNLKQRIAILRDVGYDDDAIRDMIWMSFGNSLSRLGRHQDARLIGGAE